MGATTHLQDANNIRGVRTTTSLLQGVRWWALASGSSAQFYRQYDKFSSIVSDAGLPLQCDSLLEGNQELPSELVLLMLLWCWSTKDHLRHKLLLVCSYQQKLTSLYKYHSSNFSPSSTVQRSLSMGWFWGEMWGNYYIHWTHCLWCWGMDLVLMFLSDSKTDNFLCIQRQERGVESHIPLVKTLILASTSSPF